MIPHVGLLLVLSGILPFDYSSKSLHAEVNIVASMENKKPPCSIDVRWCDIRCFVVVDSFDLWKSFQLDFACSLLSHDLCDDKEHELSELSDDNLGSLWYQRLSHIICVF